MKQHKKYVLNWHARTITVYIAGEFSHTVNFAEALDYQRNIVRLLVASLDRNGFQLTGYTDDKAWVYEGRAA